MLFAGLTSLACSAYYVCPRVICTGMALLAVLWALQHQSSIKEITPTPPDLPTGHSKGDIFSIRVSSYQINLAGVEWTTTKPLNNIEGLGWIFRFYLPMEIPDPSVGIAGLEPLSSTVSMNENGMKVFGTSVSQEPHLWTVTIVKTKGSSCG